MKRFAATLAAGVFLALVLTGMSAGSSQAGPVPLRLGYLDRPGSALCRIAAGNGYFRRNGLKVTLVRFTDTRSGLAALEAGTIDAGAFPVADTLTSIASGSGIRIIAGGGTEAVDPLTAELDEAGWAERQGRGIVVTVPKQAPAKGTLTQLTVALIQAYRSLSPDPGRSARRASRTAVATGFNPNPDYYRLERIWRNLGLQQAAMAGDYLASHVYEEIYCDALDLLVDGSPDDPVYRELSGKAVCVPDCCPKGRKSR